MAEKIGITGLYLPYYATAAANTAVATARAALQGQNTDHSETRRGHRAQ